MNAWYSILDKALALSALAGVAGLLAAMPSLSRPEIFFGVTVRAEFRKTREGRSILRAYRAVVLLAGALALATGLAGFVTQSTPLIVAFPLILCAATMAAYLRGHSQAKAFRAEPSALREAALLPERRRLPGGPLAQIGPFLILALTGLYLRLHWESLPGRIPVHWTSSGVVDGWLDRTPLAVGGALASFGVVCGVLFLSAYATLHWSRMARGSGDQAVREFSYRRIVLLILLGSEYLMALVGAWPLLVTALPFPGGAPPGLLIMLVVVSLSMGAIILATVYAGRRWSHPAPQGTRSTDQRPAGDGTFDDDWKWGIIYVNRQDPSLFIAKRFGIGYTLNLGNPWSWALMVAFAALIGLVIWLGP